MDDDHEDIDHSEELQVPAPDEIDWNALPNALASLQLFDDPYLRMQATNLGIVDQFITQLEYQVLEENFLDAPDISGLAFLNAQSQMWIFSAYELLRTWRGRVKDVIKWYDNGGLQVKIDALAKQEGFVHFGKRTRAAQLARVRDDPSIVHLMRDDLRMSHILFGQLDFLRVSLAKHEVKGRGGSVALAPGYGRMNVWSGSLEYELEAGRLSLGTLSHRNVADGIRALSHRSEMPTDEYLSSFDEFMRARDVPSIFAGGDDIQGD